MVVSKLVDGFFLVGGIRKRCRLIYQEEEVLPLNDPFPTVLIPLFSSLQRTRLDSIKLTNVRIHNLVERNPRSVGVHSSRAFLTEGSSSIVSSNRLIVASAVHQVQTLLSLSLSLFVSVNVWVNSQQKGKIKITLWKRNKAEKRLFLFIFVYRYYALETLSFFPFLRERMKDVSRGIRIKEEEKEGEREYVWNNLTGGVTHLKKHEKRKCYGRGSKRRTERLNNLIKYEY